MATLKIRSGGATYSLTGYSARGAILYGFNSALCFRSGSSTYYIPLSTNLSHANASKLRVRVSGATHAALLKSTQGISVVLGGYNSSNSIQSSMEYFKIQDSSYSTTPRNLVLQRTYMGACSNASGSLGIIAGGGTGVVYTDSIEYFNVVTPGNASTFGLLDTNRGYNAMASNAESGRGLTAGGLKGSGSSNYLTSMEYMGIGTSGGGLLYGNLTAKISSFDATSNGILEKAMWCGGRIYGGSSTVDDMEYSTINTLTSSTYFGDMITGRRFLSTTSNRNNNRGVNFAGYSAITSIDYFNLAATTGNATFFGSLSTGKFSTFAATSGQAEGAIVGGGYDAVTTYSRIDKITINTTGNAAYFADLATARYGAASTSDS